MTGVVFLLLAGFLLVLGLPLAVRGWIGRRVGDHPYCAKCGFDLRGRPDGATLCSECGASLTAPGAMVLGERHRRPKALTVGLLLSLLGLAVLTPLTLSWAGAIDWQSHKPVWWLKYEAQSLSATVRDDALNELLDRQVTGKLSAAQTQSIVDLGLAVQADVSKTWSPRWGAFIENEIVAGTLSPEKITTYAKQATTYQFEVRPAVNFADTLPMSLSAINGRDSNGLPGSSVVSRAVLLKGPLLLNDTTVDKEPDFSSGIQLFAFSGLGGMTSRFDLQKHLRTLREGPVRISGAFEVTIRKGNPEIGTILAQYTFPVTAETTVLPADKPSVTLVHDESLRPLIEATLTVPALAPLQIDVGPVPLPIALAYDIYAVQPTDGRERWLGTVHFSKDQTYVSWYIGANLLPPDVKTPDILLRPSVETARRTIDISEIWGGEIRIPHDKIGR